MIYLDSAATSYHKPDGVARAVAEAISHMGNPGRGAHEASLDASRVVYGTREKMAELFGAEEASQIKEYDYLIINDDLDRCVDEVYQVISNERSRVSRNKMMINDLSERLKAYKKGE